MKIRNIAFVLAGGLACGSVGGYFIGAHVVRSEEATVLNQLPNKQKMYAIMSSAAKLSCRNGEYTAVSDPMDVAQALQTDRTCVLKHYFEPYPSH